MTPSDCSLMARIRARDAKAFGVLFSLHSATAGRISAEDLTQEVCIRLWDHAEQWRAHGAFKVWLLRIATNAALNHLRSAKRRREQPFDILTALLTTDSKIDRHACVVAGLAPAGALPLQAARKTYPQAFLVERVVAHKLREP